MDSDLATIAACASAFAAISALTISFLQIRQSNRQALFSRRLNLWLTTEKLMDVYGENAKHLKPSDEVQLANSLRFSWLTNTSSLQEIGPAISNVLDGEWQLKLHRKLDEMRSQASEARISLREIRVWQSVVFRRLPKVAIQDVSVSNPGKDNARYGSRASLIAGRGMCRWA